MKTVSLKSLKAPKDRAGADEYKNINWRTTTPGVARGPFVQRKASCACGGGCPACEAKNRDVKVSQPDDPAEIEADRMADQVMRMPSDAVAPDTSHSANRIYRKFDTDEIEEDGEAIQRKTISLPAASSQFKGRVSGGGSGGRQLDGDTRNFFEPRFGLDLSGVRIHTDEKAQESAKAIDALAYTSESHIVFGQGQYDPSSDTGKHLLAHELAHVVQNTRTPASPDRTKLKRRGGKKKPEPKPPPEPDYFIDASKKIFQKDGTTEVGFETDDGKRFVTADAKDIHFASDGELTLGNSPPLPLRKFFELKANVLPTSPLPDHTAIVKKSLVSASYRMFSGTNNFEVLNGGTKTSSIPSPVPVSKLHKDIASKFVVNTVIDLASKHYWVLFDFKKPGSADSLNWARAKETGKEFSARQKEIDDVIGTLPAGLRDEAQKHSALISGISVAEGDFKAAATGRDTSASLGIFQWALDKDTSTDRNSSLVKFFQKLKKRAEDASKKDIKVRTDEEKMFIGAWNQLTDLGLDVTAAGAVKVGTDPATGSKLQTLLASEFGSGNLKKYQLRAALDQISTVQSMIIRPIAGMKNPFGSGYSDTFDEGATAFFKSKVKITKEVRGKKKTSEKSFEIKVSAPASFARLSDILKNEESLALATTIYTNRPSFVPTSIWLSVKGEDDHKAEVTEHLQKIAEIENAAGKSLMPIDMASLEAESLAHLEELQKLVWIDKGGITQTESEVVEKMIKFSLSFYPTADLKRYERWERIATAKAPFTSPNW